MIFRNVSVIFVGPSPILKGKHLGEEIEKVDVVVKTGPAALIEDLEYFKDYGERIDVLYCNTTFCRNMQKYKSTELISKFKKRGIKIIKVRLREPNFFHELKKNFEVEEIDPKFVNSIFQDSLALMGTIAILDILKDNPKSLAITGMDFNLSRGAEFIHVPKPNDYTEYVDGYINDTMKISMDKMRLKEIRDAHNVFNDAKLIYKLWEDGKISIPDFVLEKLNALLLIA